MIESKIRLSIYSFYTLKAISLKKVNFEYKMSQGSGDGGVVWGEGVKNMLKRCHILIEWPLNIFLKIPKRLIKRTVKIRKTAEAQKMLRKHFYGGNNTTSQQ